MNANDDLNELGGLWQSLDDRAAPARPVADIAKRQRAQRLQLAGELAISFTGTVVGAVLIARGSAAIGAAAIAFSLFGAVVGWLTRTMNIGVLERSVTEQLAASAAILKAKRNHDVAGVAMFVAGLVFYAFVRSRQVAGFGVADVAVPAGLAALAAFYLRRAVASQRLIGLHSERERELSRPD